MNAVGLVIADPVVSAMLGVAVVGAGSGANTAGGIRCAMPSITC